MNVNLHYFPGRRRGDQFDVYRRCFEAFKKQNIHLNFYPDLLPSREGHCDCVILQHYMATPEVIETLDCPVIIEESEDASMPAARQALHAKNVVALYKVSVPAPKYINLQVKRLHAWMITKNENHQRRTLTEYEIAKIQPGIHFGMYDRMMPWIKAAPTIDLDDWDKRPTDVMFAGRIDAYDPEINLHRKFFYDGLKAISDLNIICEGTRAYPLKEYRRLSRRTKIIVSPWGNGELCYRDFEAMFDGCVLIKPNTDFVHVLGNILNPHVTYIPCSHDASDLRQIIYSILAEPEQFEEMRLRNYTLALDWFSSDRIATWWKAEFENLLK